MTRYIVLHDYDRGRGKPFYRGESEPCQWQIFRQTFHGYYGGVPVFVEEFATEEEANARCKEFNENRVGGNMPNTNPVATEIARAVQDFRKNLISAIDKEMRELWDKTGMSPTAIHVELVDGTAFGDILPRMIVADVRATFGV